MLRSITLTLVDGVKIVVPDSFELITPYVLTEQQDWFEPELAFLRRVLGAGQKLIDIGANYGVYALSLARVVGATGTVHAFEPASSTAAMLRQSVAANGFRQIVVDGCALSGECGTARLALSDHAELNSLVHEQGDAGRCESVPMVTLDAGLERYGWSDVDFLKMDAEGEEAAILRGGARFFADCSPLVMFEVKAGAGFRADLVADFLALGYAVYRLVPGLHVLAPFDTAASPDRFLLNLFACKADRGAQLALRGALIEAAVQSTVPDPKDTLAAAAGRPLWQEAILRLPYARGLAPAWTQAKLPGPLSEALSLYALSQDTTKSPLLRYQALTQSFERLRDICAAQPGGLRLASLARVAADLGERAIALDAVRQLAERIQRTRQVDSNEPFLAPLARFDDIAPRAALGNWVLAAVLEALERLVSFSSFYTRESARVRLEAIGALGYGSEEMRRRLQLVEARLGARPATR